MHHSDPWLPAWLEKVKKARDRGAGGFADAPTRRWVESRVMMYLAGGLAHERAKSIESSGVSLGWGLGDGRDKANARDLLESLSSSNNEAGAYLSWLIARPDHAGAARRLVGRRRGGWALLERRTLSAKEVRQVIGCALEAEDQRSAAWNWACVGA